jgi:predicted metal-binding membrane protein
MASTPTTQPPQAVSLTSSDALTVRQAAGAAVSLTVVIMLSWVLTLRQAHGMDTMAGTMGLGFLPFLLMWVPMVIAMMFPTVGPSAIVAVQARRVALKAPQWTLSLRASAFLLSYLLVWTAFGALVYGVAAGLEALINVPAGTARWLGAGIYAIAGLYQLTRVKDACRERCRSCRCAFEDDNAPRRVFETVRVAASHGVYCVGCCWAYMVVLIAVGMTNLVAMAGLAVVIFIERHLPRRPVIVSRLAGAALLAIAVLTPFVSWLHPGLSGGSPM